MERSYGESRHHASLLRLWFFVVLVMFFGAFAVVVMMLPQTSLEVARAMTYVVVAACALVCCALIWWAVIFVRAFAKPLRVLRQSLLERDMFVLSEVDRIEVEWARSVLRRNCIAGFAMLGMLIIWISSMALFRVLLHDPKAQSGSDEHDILEFAVYGLIENLCGFVSAIALAVVSGIFARALQLKNVHRARRERLESDSSDAITSPDEASGHAANSRPAAPSMTGELGAFDVDAALPLPPLAIAVPPSGVGVPVPPPLEPDTATAHPCHRWGTAGEHKVEELAHRCVPLECLLSFYMKLCAHDVAMRYEDYADGKSTTGDVVRQAIIPMTAANRCAMARRWASVEPKPADCMVTHSWQNRFQHLVSAVVADGLNVNSYGLVGTHLTHEKHSQLKQNLLSLNTLRKRYWICAFSVNQHRGICGSHGPDPPSKRSEYAAWDRARRDTSTGKLYPLCNCRCEKYLNNSPLCEMNKFDCMMDYLQVNVPRFNQVIAVDREFTLFQRAWCIAELDKAHNLNITQHVKIYAHVDLERHRSKLEKFDVNKCKASRPEDKAEIMSRIGDAEKFNERVRGLVLGVGGLFTRWCDGEALLVTAGMVVAREVRRQHGILTPEPSREVSMETSSSSANIESSGNLAGPVHSLRNMLRRTFNAPIPQNAATSDADSRAHQMLLTVPQRDV
eukprot:NODE_1559_length_2437_cov_17.043290.p1 GENE.NODE_1559_length_2437_cov_17.043290~~NODE_1559_length_2437_cov_17.043290.p1  ORF type:complete len:709 (-),score=179.33 NODE_1559_length_2437_cov_17.043290:311-2344(-)